MRHKKIASLLSVILVSTNLSIFASPTIFDLKKDASVLEKFKSYRKCSGFLKADLYNLPVVTCGMIVDNYLSKKDIEKVKSSVGDTFMCRTDAPIKDWYGLPKGRELKVEQINEFFSKCREVNPKATLLCFLIPCKYFTGKYIERYEKNGSANVIFDWGKNIIIEYVGQGFDGGELTKGKNTSHTSICIPWCFTECPAWFIWNFANIKNISEKSYELSRKKRIESLVELGYSEEKVRNAVPTSPVYMSKEMFVNIFNNCIKQIIKYSRDFDPKVTTMMLIDLYGKKQHVVEIWNSNL